MPSGRNLSILIVDDNRDQVDVLARLFAMEGHTVHVAYNGVEAIAQAVTESPQVVIMDLWLPKLNGHDAAKVIRYEFGSSVRIVALSGWPAEDRDRTNDLIFDAYLQKPVEWGELKKAALPDALKELS